MEEKQVQPEPVLRFRTPWDDAERAREQHKKHPKTPWDDERPWYERPNRDY